MRKTKTASWKGGSMRWGRNRKLWFCALTEQNYIYKTVHISSNNDNKSAKNSSKPAKAIKCIAWCSNAAILLQPADLKKLKARATKPQSKALPRSLQTTFWQNTTVLSKTHSVKTQMVACSFLRKTAPLSHIHALQKIVYDKVKNCRSVKARLVAQNGHTQCLELLAAYKKHFLSLCDA